MSQLDTISKLEQLAARYRFLYGGVASGFRQLAADLSFCVRRDSSWGWQYIHQAAHQKLTISGRLAQAILILYADVVGKSAPQFEPIRAIAPVGLIEGVVLIGAAARTCVRENCGRNFIPVHPSQRYCNPRCRQYSRKKRKYG